jgi:hypothetical protein
MEDLLVGCPRMQSLNPADPCGAMFADLSKIIL